MGAIESIPVADEAAYERLLDQCRHVLTGGGLAVLPAEGLYGLHACTADPGAVGRLRHIKHESSRRPFIVLIHHTSQLETISPAATAIERSLIATAWPGPLTLLLPAAENLPDDLVQGGQVAIRCPGSPFLRDLAARLPGLLLTTSANRAGAPAPAAVSDLDSAVAAGVDLIVDGGTLAGQGSTLARFNESGELEIIRPGLWTTV